jgi:hypothetical protein
MAATASSGGVRGEETLAYTRDYLWSKMYGYD